MTANPLQAKRAAGEAALNGWLILGNAFSAELMAAQGFDSVTIDLQHGVMSEADLLPMLQGVRASGAAALVRPGWLDPTVIMRALDMGADGIICPMISNRAEAEALVSYCRYPPLGMRSFGPVRASIVHGDDYYDGSNDNVLCLAMIETAEAVENLEDIIATPGLDGIYVGPNDLAIGVSKGELKPGTDRYEDEMIALTQRILKAAKDNGSYAGLHCGSAEGGARGIKWGFDLVTMAADFAILTSGAQAELKKTRELAAGG